LPTCSISKAHPQTAAPCLVVAEWRDIDSCLDS
jgi:hypothetical protein